MGFYIQFGKVGDEMEKVLQQKKVTKRPFVLIAIMIAMFMSAVEATIVSTAMPKIVAELGKFSLYSWVFSSYLLMQTVTILIYGKLSDLFGRKPVFTFGVIVFILGSLLCGLSTSMEMLILFRFIQGFGAGAVQPIATTIVGDMYSKEERAKIQGYLSSVWGISSILGPALGGFFVMYASWSYVFWLNIPLGILSLIGVWFFFHENMDKQKQSIDYLGSAFVFIGISALMLVLVEGGVRYAWLSTEMLSLMSVSILFFVLFIWQEKRSKNPTMPFEMWRNRLILTSNLTSLTTGMILIGVSSYLPAFVQGVMGKSALVAGFSLTTMSIGWPIASTLAGKLVLKYHYRNVSIVGGIFLIIGAIIFSLLTPVLGPWWAALGSFIIGIGMGLTSTTFIIAIQTTVDWSKRGIATATNLFMRSLGSTVGAAFLGGILNSQLKREIEQAGLSTERVSVDMTNVLLDPILRGEMSSKMINVLEKGLTTGLHTVYMTLVLLSVISFFFIMKMPKKNRE